MNTGNGDKRGGDDDRQGPGDTITLEARPERVLLRPSGSFRHVDFRVRVGDRRDGAAPGPLVTS